MRKGAVMQTTVAVIGVKFQIVTAVTTYVANLKLFALHMVHHLTLVCQKSAKFICAANCAVDLPVNTNAPTTRNILQFMPT